MSRKLEVFDPPMCCSSGVCGTNVDARLVQFAGDLEHLKEKGVDVRRYNLSSEPAAFVQNAVVKQALNDDGNDCLPLVLIDGKLLSKGRYPARNELLDAAGLDTEAKPESAASAGTKCGSGCCCS